MNQTKWDKKIYKNVPIVPDCRDHVAGCPSRHPLLAWHRPHWETAAQLEAVSQPHALHHRHLACRQAKCITLGPKVLVSLCVSFYFPFHGLATEDREAPGNSRVEGTWWQSLQELPSCQENPVPTASWVRNKLVALAFSQGWCLCSGRCQPVQYR